MFVVTSQWLLQHRHSTGGQGRRKPSTRAVDAPQKPRSSGQRDEANEGPRQLGYRSMILRLVHRLGIDRLTMPRNARTRPEVIDRFYAAPLQG
jgi:transposase-like protein